MALLRTETVDGLMIVRLGDGRANTIGSAWLNVIEGLLDAIGDSRGLVISGQGRFFSTGLDLVEVHALDRPAMTVFINRFDDLLLRLMTLPMPTVAAINGHAVAGGLLVASACDVRLAAPGNYRIGINTLALGIPLPMMGLLAMKRAVPVNKQHQVLAEGVMLDPQEAGDLGLVRLAKGDLIDEAVATVLQLSRSPGAYARLKQHLLDPHLEYMATHREAVNGDFIDAWFTAEAIRRREEALEELATNNED